MRLVTLETYRLGPESPHRPPATAATTATPLVMPAIQHFSQKGAPPPHITLAQRPLATQPATNPSSKSEPSSKASSTEPADAPGTAAATAAARFPKADRHIMPAFGPTTQKTPWPNHNLRYLVHQLEDLRLNQVAHGTIFPACTELERNSSVEQDITEAWWTHFDDAGRKTPSRLAAHTIGAALSTSQSQQRNLPLPAETTGSDYLNAVEQAQSVLSTSSVSARRSLWLSAASALSKFKPNTANTCMSNDSAAVHTPLQAAILSTGSMFAQFGFDRDLDNIVPVPIVVQTPGAHTRDPICDYHSSASNSLPSSVSVSPSTQPSDASSPRTPFDAAIGDSPLEEPTPFELDAGESEEDLVDLMLSSAMLLGKLQASNSSSVATYCDLTVAVDMQDAGRVVF